MANVRIKDLTTDSALAAGDYVVIDSASEGSRKFDLGTEISGLKEDFSGWDSDTKLALLNAFAHVAWTDEHGQDYYDALEAALYPEEPPATLESISAVYTQSGTVYTTDSIDDLKADLVVTAHYDDGTDAEVTTYTLSGTLGEGTATITVGYLGKTDTFTVNCTVNGWLYHFNESLLSSGSEDFNLVGTGVYDTGLFDKKCYKHFTPTSGTASTDTQYGLKALALTDPPDFNGDFTVSFWMATQADYYNHAFTFAKYVNTSEPSSSNRYFSNLVAEKTGWNISQYGASNKYAGLSIYGNTSNRYVIITAHSGDLVKSGQLQIQMPSSIDTKEWHHYAFTRKGTKFRFFFDGELAASADTNITTVYNAAQVAISSNFTQSSAQSDVIQQMPNGEKLQDLYIAEFCKWETDFDPDTIEY